jgi:hypothetical protein
MQSCVDNGTHLKLYERNVCQQAQPLTTYNMYCRFPGQSFWIIEGELYATNLWPLTDTRTDSNWASMDRVTVTKPFCISNFTALHLAYELANILSDRRYEIPVTAAIK